MQGFYEICTVCYMNDHSMDTCPTMEFQGGFRANQPWNNLYASAYDLGWCPQLNSWCNNNQNPFQAPQSSYQAYHLQPPEGQSLEELINSLSPTYQAPPSPQKESLEELINSMAIRMEQSSKKMEESSMRMEAHVQQIMCTLRAWDDVDASLQQQLKGEIYEDKAPCFATELEACEDSDDKFFDVEFDNEGREIKLIENDFQVPEAIMITHEDHTCYKGDMGDYFEEESITIHIAEPLSTPHERQLDTLLPVSSYIHVPFIEEVLEFDKEPMESPWYHDHMEMVISDHHKPYMEILFFMHIEHTKWWQRRKRRHGRKSLGPYRSILTTEQKLLTRAHATSLKKSFMKKTIRFLTKSSSGVGGFITIA